MRRRSLLGLAVLALPAVAHAQTPFGPEFRVNVHTTLAQRFPVVAADAAGRFVVAWDRTYGVGVFAQRYDAAGRPLGDELRISTEAIHDGDAPSIAGAPDGSFAVAWTSNFDGDVGGIFARRFGASGTPLGPDFRVNSYITSFQYEPQLAMNANGSFVVVWAGNGPGDDSGVFGQRFDGAGNPQGAQFRVNSYTTAAQRWPSVAVAPSGAFLVVWDSSGQEGDSWEVFGRRYDAQGTPLGSEFHINTYTPGFQFTPRVAVDGAGNFVVVWDDSARAAVAGRRFDASGNPLGAEFTIAGSPSHPQVAAAANGAFMVVWEDGDNDVFAKRFDAGGTPGATFRANRYTVGFQADPSVTVLPQGVVVVWSKDDRDGIFARRFADIGPFAVAVDPVAGPGSDGNAILEAGETIAFEPVWLNSAAVATSGAGIASQFTGPGSPDPAYTITDANATYSNLLPGIPASCLASTDCYALAVGMPSARPAAHWDAHLREDLTASGLLPAASWTLHIGESFSDVPRASSFYRFVETLLHHGVTGGCQAGAYCPTAPTTRDQMAVFVLRGFEPPWYAPMQCMAGSEVFADVPASSPFCAWIQELWWRGVAGGCGGGNYCPGDAVTREQMAVFVLRTLDPALSPLSCTTPMFADVPASSPFCRWIEELARRGVVTGCGGGNYCPTAPVTREQMAVFIAETFRLTLYGP